MSFKCFSTVFVKPRIGFCPSLILREMRLLSRKTGLTVIAEINGEKIEVTGSTNINHILDSLTQQNSDEAKDPLIRDCYRGLMVSKLEAEKIKEVTPSDEYYKIVTDQDTHFSILKARASNVVPQPQDTIVFYTIGWSRVVGVELNGKLLYFLSDEDE